MKISEQWLREWASPKLDTQTLAQRLTMAGLEVGAIEPVAPALDHVVVGEILSVAAHPAAEKLLFCRVAVAPGKELAIVCGATNAATGMKVPVALAGARLPDNTVIKTTEIRGVASSGMLCSAAELGLEDSASGLLELDHDAKVGTSLKSHLQLDDTTFEIDLTPNRGDCLSVAGLAREIAAITGARLHAPRLKSVAARSQRKLPVVLRAPRDCPYYAGRVIEDIDPQVRTPMWLKERLRRSSVRAIHPVVDVTNYVMLELGQPMHAFDLDRLTGGIEVRRARAKESLVLLDGKEIRLEAGVLLIADRNGPLALAGIMGGQAAAVGSETRNLFLESAWFRPEVIAGRARAMGLQTESSQRFERGVDPTMPRRAVERATALLLEIVGGKPGPVIEQRDRRYLPRTAAITLRAARIEKLLGFKIAASEVQKILRRLGMPVKKSAQGWRVLPPSWRFDLSREVDLIEEIARLHGYENLPVHRPQTVMTMTPSPEGRLPASRLRTALVDRDYQEIVTYSFVDPVWQIQLDPAVTPIRLANPISADMAVMRTSLWPGLLKTVAYNLNRQLSRLRFFELGRCFIPVKSGIDQEPRLGGAVTGSALPEQWGGAMRAVDFYDVKADIEALLQLGGNMTEFRHEAACHPALHPGQSARILYRGETVGWLGALHPEIQAKLGLEQAVILFELRLSSLDQAKLPVFHEISRFPAIRRDIAIVVQENLPARVVLDSVTKVAGKLLVNLELFDEYRGKGIDSGRKSLALGLTLQDSSRTLKEDEVDALIARVVAVLESELGARLRR
jgi:phenylalanyl-tRNA synthetase beta chain